MEECKVPSCDAERAVPTANCSAINAARRNKTPVHVSNCNFLKSIGLHI